MQFNHIDKSLVLGVSCFLIFMMLPISKCMIFFRIKGCYGRNNFLYRKLYFCSPHHCTSSLCLQLNFQSKSLAEEVSKKFWLHCLLCSVPPILLKCLEFFD